jgi:trimeric autotransporter adhesin
MSYRIRLESLRKLKLSQCITLIMILGVGVSGLNLVGPGLGFGPPKIRDPMTEGASFHFADLPTRDLSSRDAIANVPNFFALLHSGKPVSGDRTVGRASLSVTYSYTTAGAMPFNSSFFVYVTSGTPPFKFTWHFGDGSSFSSNITGNTTHVYTNAGTFAIELFVNDSTNATFQGNGTIIVEAVQLQVSPLALSQPSIDVGQSIGINASVSGGSGNYNYTWYGLPAGCVSLNVSGLSCSPNGTGNFSTFLTVIDSAGVQVPSNPVTIRVYPPPSPPSVTASASSVDVGQSLRLSLSMTSVGSGIESVVWTGLPSGCSSQNSTSLTCVPSGQGNFLVSAEVSDSNGYAISGPASTIMVFPQLVVATPNVTGDHLDLGQAFSYSTSASGGRGGYTYVWLGVPLGCPSGNSPKYSCRPNITGAFNLRVTVEDSNRNQNESGSVNVTVSSVLSITVDVGPARPTVGSLLYVNTTISGGTPPYSVTYSGLPPGCLTANVKGLVCTPSESGLYKISVSALDGANVTASTSSNASIAAASGSSTSAIYWGLVVGGVLIAVSAGLLLLWWVRKRPKQSIPAEKP